MVSPSLIVAGSKGVGDGYGLDDTGLHWGSLWPWGFGWVASGPGLICCLACFFSLFFFSLSPLSYTRQHDSTLGAAWSFGRWVSLEMSID